MSETEYVPCPNCDGTMLTERYKSRYGQCNSCYLPLGVKISRAL